MKLPRGVNILFISCEYKMRWWRKSQWSGRQFYGDAPQLVTVFFCSLSLSPALCFSHSFSLALGIYFVRYNLKYRYITANMYNLAAKLWSLCNTVALANPISISSIFLFIPSAIVHPRPRINTHIHSSVHPKHTGISFIPHYFYQFYATMIPNIFYHKLFRRE